MYKPRNVIGSGGMRAVRRRAADTTVEVEHARDTELEPAHDFGRRLVARDALDHNRRRLLGVPAWRRRGALELVAVTFLVVARRSTA